MSLNATNIDLFKPFFLPTSCICDDIYRFFSDILISCSRRSDSASKKKKQRNWGETAILRANPPPSALVTFFLCAPPILLLFGRLEPSNIFMVSKWGAQSLSVEFFVDVDRKKIKSTSYKMMQKIA